MSAPIPNDFQKPRVSNGKGSELHSRERREVRKLTTLMDFGRQLADAANPKGCFGPLLETLGRHHGIIRSFIMLMADDEKIRMEAMHGLNEEVSRRVTYRIGEGV